MSRILIVEDHAVVRRALEMVLIEAGHEVVLADGFDGTAVVRSARQCRPDVAVLDLYLGRWESTPLVRPLCDLGTSVVVLTACDEAPLLGNCIEAGAVAVVSKADELDDLLRVVELALAGSSPMRPADRDSLVAAARQARRAEAERASVISLLTPRERLVLQHLASGRSAEDIARSEFVSLTTVRTHIRAVLAKLGVNSQLGAVAMAHRAGWVPAA